MYTVKTDLERSRKSQKGEEDEVRATRKVKYPENLTTVGIISHDRITRRAYVCGCQYAAVSGGNHDGKFLVGLQGRQSRGLGEVSTTNHCRRGIDLSMLHTVNVEKQECDDAVDLVKTRLHVSSILQFRLLLPRLAAEPAVL